MFKNKKFRARSGCIKNPTHRIETLRVQTTYAERKDSVIGKQDNDKDTLPINNTIITKLHVFLCRCACHKKSKIANSEPGHYSYDPEVEHSTVGVQKNAA